MKYKTIKGVQDILPPETFLWQEVEQTAKEIFSLYGFKEIRTPILEFTELFVRSIGETTDIVEKEMYTFQDRAGRSITLRPEGTASVVRAYIQHGLSQLPAPQKFYYIGPMFRYERPQKGRYRQFHQIGVEVFGVDSPDVDAELIDMIRAFLQRIGLDSLSIEINSIGCEQCRPFYRERLIEFLSSGVDTLCNDCQRRYQKNPLRVLDCKVPTCKEFIKDAPRITDFLCDGCKEHFQKFQQRLKALEIQYSINPEMVRGLDYYTRTTFEITSNALGAQNAVAAGGRYDRLVESFGGPPTPAVGFAIGMERLIVLLSELKPPRDKGPMVYFVTLGEEASEFAFKELSHIRSAGFSAEMDFRRSSLKSQMRRADKAGARLVFIVGEDELSKGIVKYRDLREHTEGEIDKQGVLDFLKNFNF
ncbi:MAG: histidine--tRNA ligase [Nitrospirae bacterium]|nr:histidine--tRNA ligase [Nitrospirota bacterium]